MNCSTDVVTKSLRILIVDDSALNRKMLRKCYAQQDYEVDEAIDGQAAVERVFDGSGEVFDVISLDNLMPRMNGPETACELRRRGYTGKIIGVTGNVLKEDMQEFLDKGADAVLGKPIDIELFKRTVLSPGRYSAANV